MSTILPVGLCRTAALRAAAVAVWVVVVLAGGSAWAAKNVILMISDGAGFNVWIAASMYQGKLGKQLYDGPEWVTLGVSTHPLNLSSKPKRSGVQDASLVYDPLKAWDTAEAIEHPRAPDPDNDEEDPGPKTPTKTFAGYIYLKRGATDSAAAGTAMATGIKSFNSAINWSDDDKPLAGKTIAELAHAAGKRVGVVTSVQWSHATPAALGGAHNVTRRDYAGIANEMLDSTWLDVIMGAGHPEYLPTGKRNPLPLLTNYRYVGGVASWAKLRFGSHPGGWTLIQTPAEFQALRTGPTPERVLGTAQVHGTLQQQRSLVKPVPADKPYPYSPFDVPLNEDVPKLAVMVEAALNCLDDDPDGMFLMVEGGAVDWACHANQGHRMIEEQLDFLAAVESVIKWIEKNSTWEQTLLILTADHETGLLWGPQSDTIPFQPLEDRGPGNLPGMRFNSGNHTNSLVPLYARGAGSQRFLAEVVGTDKTAAEKWRFSGRYVDNTAIFRVMKAEIEAQAGKSQQTPQPAPQAPATSPAATAPVPTPPSAPTAASTPAAPTPPAAPDPAAAPAPAPAPAP